jgi:hypothetical protein
MAAIAAMKAGRRFMAATLPKRGDQEEPCLDAGLELAESGTRRAVPGADCTAVKARGAKAMRHRFGAMRNDKRRGERGLRV